jgi:hypothetical protein
MAADPKIPKALFKEKYGSDKHKADAAAFWEHKSTDPSLPNNLDQLFAMKVRHLKLVKTNHPDATTRNYAGLYTLGKKDDE